MSSVAKKLELGDILEPLSHAHEQPTPALQWVIDHGFGLPATPTVMPHDYAPGTPIHLHLHWSEAVTGQNERVRWGFEYTIAKGHGQEAFHDPATVFVVQASASQHVHMVAETAVGVQSASIEPDSLILVRAFEYQWAEQEAIAYRDAGFQGSVPAMVSAWARAKNSATRPSIAA